MTSAEQALSLLLKRPEHAADPRVACRLLQVSKGCRAVVQQSDSGVCYLRATWQPSGQSENTKCVAGMLSWMLKYPRLVGSVKLYKWEERDPYPPVSRRMNQQRGPVLHCVLLANTQQASLQLRSFSSCNMDVNAVRALPATITSLEVNGISSAASSGPSLAQLAQLRNLKLFHAVSVQWEHLSARTVEFLSSLKSLTELSIRDISNNSDLGLLPAALQRLTLCCKSCANVGPELQLSHLTMLRKLHISSCKPASASLPCQLVDLNIHYYDAPEFSVIDTQHISELHQLQRLSMPLAPEDAGLSGLNSLRQLTHLVLTACDNKAACIYPAVHDSISQLVSLSVHAFGEWMDWFKQLVTQALPTAKGLTALHLFTDCDDWQVWDGFSPWPLLAGLTSLRMLSMQFGYIEMMSELSGISQLSSLSHLTHIEILGQWSHLCSEMDLQVMVQNMSELHVLHVGFDPYDTNEDMPVGTWGIGPLVVIRQLSQLRSLWYDILSTEDAQSGVLLLTGLSRLTELRGFEKAGDEALDSFWKAVKCVV